PGDKVTLKVLRGKESKEVVLTVGPRMARPGPARPTRPNSFWYGGQRENVQNQQGPEGFQYGGVYKSADGGESWTRVNSVNPRPTWTSSTTWPSASSTTLTPTRAAPTASTAGSRTTAPGADPATPSTARGRSTPTGSWSAAATASSAASMPATPTWSTSSPRTA